MAKIEHDKYYTPQHIVDLVIQRTKEVIGLENISEFIEPSAGNGAFLDKLHILGKPVYAYDLYPEREDIVEQDYLKLDKEYNKGVCVIGNPPFGDKNILIKKFYNKSVDISDYIVFVLPITQLENTQSLYKFKLVYSEDLKVQFYSNIEVHCCLNIYKRDESGNLLQKPNYNLKDIDIIEYKRGKESYFEDFDFSVCTWGNGCCGKTPKFKGEFAQEHYIIIKNEKLKNRILEVCKNTDWKNNVAPKNTSSKKIQTWRIYKYLKEQIPELN